MVAALQARGSGGWGLGGRVAGGPDAWVGVPTGSSVPEAGDRGRPRDSGAGGVHRGRVRGRLGVPAGLGLPGPRVPRVGLGSDTWRGERRRDRCVHVCREWGASRGLEGGPALEVCCVVSL